MSDYDYVDYFGGRALGSSSGRSLSDLDNTDVVDDDDDAEENDAEEGAEGSSGSRPRNGTDTENGEPKIPSSRSLLSGWRSMFEGGRKSWWIDTAASGFHFVLDAIDKMPQ